MKIYRIKAVDHYSDEEHILNVQYILVYGSLVEENPFYLRITAFWLFILGSDNMYKFHPLGWDSPMLNVLRSNIVHLSSIEV